MQEFFFHQIIFHSYRVCSEIHIRNGEYGQVLRCYLLDPIRKHEVFDYLEHSPHKEELQSNVMENLDVS